MDWLIGTKDTHLQIHIFCISTFKCSYLYHYYCYYYYYYYGSTNVWMPRINKYYYYNNYYCPSLLLLTIVSQSRQILLVDPNRIRVLSVISLIFNYKNSIFFYRWVQGICITLWASLEEESVSRILFSFFKRICVKSRSIQKTNSISLY